mgnify:FL=1
MPSKNIRFKTPGYIFGSAMNESAINICCPNRMKDAVKKLAYKYELSVSRYVLGLIITDLHLKDPEFKEYMDSLG